MRAPFLKPGQGLGVKADLIKAHQPHLSNVVHAGRAVTVQLKTFRQNMAARPWIFVEVA